MFVNLGSNDGFTFFVAWLMAALRPRDPLSLIEEFPAPPPTVRESPFWKITDDEQRGFAGSE